MQKYAAAAPSVPETAPLEACRQFGVGRARAQVGRGGATVARLRCHRMVASDRQAYP